MGQAFIRILSAIVGTPRQHSVTRSIGTQTARRRHIPLRTLGTQTVTKFSERLTNFDTIEISSTETFDRGCNICDMYTEKEAVGYCCICKQYLCYTCCNHHENISVCENHKIVGKEGFEAMNAVNSLFDMHMVPLMKTRLPQCILSTCKRQGCKDNITVVLSSFTSDDSKSVYFLIHAGQWYSNELELIKITKDAKVQRNVLHEIESVLENNDEEKKACKYFVQKRSQYIREFTFDRYGACFQETFVVTGECNGVVPFDNGLAISLYIPTGFSIPDWQIQFLDLNGAIKKQIYYDSNGKPLFKYPGHIASNCTEDILFVSDELTNTVIALDTKGNVIYKFTHDTIVRPLGITCDEENNVYVACYKQVIQIHALGKKSRIILNTKNKQIVNLFYYKENRRLAVIEESKDATIFTFLQN